MRNTLIRITILVFALCVSAPAQSSNKDVIFRAVEDEMARSMNELKFKTFEKPYFLEYIVEESEVLGIQAAFGAIKRSNLGKSRMLFTQVRIGSYDLDNVGSFAFRLPIPLPVEDDYSAIRRSVWLVTDRSYKQAINMFEAVKASKRNQEQDDDEKVPSFIKQDPTVSIGKKGSLSVDKSLWEERVRRWSAMFRKMPEFRESRFNFYVRQLNRYLINSEGSRILAPSLLVTVDIHASASTKDNSVVETYRHLFSKSFREAPSVEDVDRQIESFAGDLKRFKSAKPFKDTYIGPAIFSRGASVQLFLQLLAPNLSGNSYADRIGRKVLPTFLSVKDDPTVDEIDGKRLAGSYLIDDEGVKAKPVSLIENGVLKTLLMTRTPIKSLRQSTGHARGGGFRGSQASISNLIIEAKNEKSIVELKKQLIDECRKQGLEYGVMFRENNATYSNFSGSSPVLVYKVYVEDGREELFREASVVDLSPRELRNILAAGDDQFHFNYLSNSSYQGTGTPTSVVAPSVLLEEVYLKKTRFRKEKERLVTHPFFSKE